MFVDVSQTRIKDSLCVPAAEMITSNHNGKLKSIDVIIKGQSFLYCLKSKESLFLDLPTEFSPDKTSITYCNVGFQSSIDSIVLEEAFPDTKIRMYNGSLKELERRAPKCINDGPMHIAA